MNHQIVESLSLVLKGLTDTFWHLREFDLQKPGYEPFQLTDPTNFCCFQLARQFKRPDEFLQALIDMIKITYYHDPFGTLLLNSNPAFIIDAARAKPFHFGYLSVLSEPNESFADVWNGKVADSMQTNKYDLKRASAVFLFVSAGEGRYGAELIGEVGEVINAGFSVDDVFSRIATAVNDEDCDPVTGIHAGYFFSEELFTRLRVSLWIFFDPQAFQPFTVIPGGKRD